MNYFSDLYIRSLLIIDLLQTSKLTRSLIEARDFLSNSWLHSVSRPYQL
jgi:hypothetical protein